MMIAAIVLVCLGLGICITEVWITSYNWLVQEHIFSYDTNESTRNFLKAFLATPFIVSALLVEGITLRILNYFCRGGK